MSKKKASVRSRSAQGRGGGQSQLKKILLDRIKNQLMIEVCVDDRESSDSVIIRLDPADAMLLITQAASQLRLTSEDAISLIKDLAEGVRETGSD